MRVPTTIIAVLLCLLGLALSTAASSSETSAEEIRIVVRESRDPQPRAIPLKFKLDTAKWEDGYLHIWGQINNPTDHDYDFVEVLFVAIDRGRKVLGRTEAYCDPQTLTRGTMGYVTDETIDTQGHEPAVLEYRVIGFQASRH